MKIRQTPPALSKKSHRQWQNALYVLNAVIDAEGFQTATVEAVEAGTLYQMTVERQDGGTIIDGPEQTVAVKELDSWFGCQFEVSFDRIELPELHAWMTTWTYADIAFLPQMLLDEDGRCRSHQASDLVEFTFVWSP